MWITVLVALCLIGYCLAFTRFSRFPIEKMPLFILGIIITILYFFAYLGQLKAGAYVVFFTGAVLFLSSPLYIKKNLAELFSRYLTPGFVFWLLITVIFCIFAARQWMRSWDDFQHWAPHAKWTYLNNGFITGNNYGGFNNYPPGADIFYYLFLMWNNYSTPVLHIAQNILLLSPLPILFSYSRWEQWKSIIIILAIAIISLWLIYNWHVGFGHTSLTIDNAISLFFSGGLLAYYFSEKKIKDIIYFLPVTFAYSLFKPAIVFFIFLTTFIILCDLILQHKENKNQNLIRSLATISLIPMVAIFATLSWKYYMQKANIEPFQLHISLHGIISILSGHGDHDQIAMLQALAKKYKDVLINFIPIVFLVMIAFRILKQEKDKIRFAVWQIILFCGSIAYLFGLILLFVFTFKDELRNIDWGFNRFLYQYFIAWSFILLGIIYQATKEKLKTKSTALFAALFLFLSLFIFWSYQAIQQPKNQIVLKGIDEVVALVKKNTPEQANVLVLMQKLGTINELNLRYQLIPRKVTVVSWTVSNHESVADFNNSIKNHDYLLIADADANFSKKHSNLFLSKTTVKAKIGYTICAFNKNTGCNRKNEERVTAYLFKINY